MEFAGRYPGAFGIDATGPRHLCHQDRPGWGPHAVGARRHVRLCDGEAVERLPAGAALPPLPALNKKT